jgi:hypothetical protein
MSWMLASKCLGRPDRLPPRRTRAEFGLCPGKCRASPLSGVHVDATWLLSELGQLPSFFYYDQPHRTIVTSPQHLQSSQPKSAVHPRLLPPTPAGNLVPAITDGIFPAHSGSRASPLRVLLHRVYRWFCFRDHIHRLVAGQPRISLLSGSTTPLTHSEAALKWQHWHRQWRGIQMQILAFNG